MENGFTEKDNLSVILNACERISALCNVTRAAASLAADGDNGKRFDLEDGIRILEIISSESDCVIALVENM